MANEQDTDQVEDTERPMPGPGHATPEGVGDGGAALDDASDSPGDSADGERPPPPDSEPEYNDRDKMDFDPDKGLYTGTAVDGGTSIPGPHVEVDDVDPEATDDEAEDADSSDE